VSTSTGEKPSAEEVDESSLLEWTSGWILESKSAFVNLAEKPRLRSLLVPESVETNPGFWELGDGGPDGLVSDPDPDSLFPAEFPKNRPTRCSRRSESRRTENVISSTETGTETGIHGERHLEYGPVRPVEDADAGKMMRASLEAIKGIVFVTCSDVAGKSSPPALWCFSVK